MILPSSRPAAAPQEGECYFSSIGDGFEVADRVLPGTGDISLLATLLTPLWEGSGVFQTHLSHRTNFSPANGAGRNLIPLSRDLRNVTLTCFIYI